MNHAVKEIKIDNFTTRPLPFRPLTPPFFNYCKNIVRYTLETEDSIVTTLEDCGDYFHFKLVINEDTQVEFFGKAYHMPPPPFYVEPTSIYELWIHKYIANAQNMPGEFVVAAEKKLKKVPYAADYLEIKDLCKKALDAGQYDYSI